MSPVTCSSTITFSDDVSDSLTTLEGGKKRGREGGMERGRGGRERHLTFNFMVFKSKKSNS